MKLEIYQVVLVMIIELVYILIGLVKQVLVDFIFLRLQTQVYHNHNSGYLQMELIT